MIRDTTQKNCVMKKLCKMRAIEISCAMTLKKLHNTVQETAYNDDNLRRNIVVITLNGESDLV